jgi:hypothetical protein
MRNVHFQDSFFLNQTNRALNEAFLSVPRLHAAQRFIVRNSWGAAWGQKGYFTIPCAYLLSQNLASDFWTVRVVE